MKKFNKKVAIITGITSFLGRSTAKYLIDKGFVVFGIIRPDSKNYDMIKTIDKLNIIKLDFFKLTSDDFNFVNSNDYYNMVIKSINNLHSDITVIHFAWSHTLDRNNFSKQMLNVDMSLKVLEFAKIIGAKRFIFAGSQAELSDSAYGMAKKQFANLAKTNLKESNLKFIHFRIFSIYGNEDRKTSLIKQLIASFKSNRDISLSSCNYLWNYLYIDDFLFILFCFISRNVISGIYDIASEDTRLLKDYIIEAHTLYKAKNKLLFGNREDSTEKFAIPNIIKTKKVIGQFNFTKFSDGIMSID